MRVKPLPPAESCFVQGNDLRNGAFIFPRPGDKDLRVIVSDGTDWIVEGLPPPVFEHVSVSLVDRCPTWAEMDWVKSLWWRDDETVVQYHVPRAVHINYHEFCLHMFRPIGVEIPLPPTETIGPKGVKRGN